VAVEPEEARSIRGRLSQIVVDAGARLAPNEHCRANFAVIVAPDPGAVIKAWYARDHGLFGDAAQSTVNSFLQRSEAVQAWYNTSSDSASGVPYSTLKAGLRSMSVIQGLPTDLQAEGSRLEFSSVRSFSSVIVAVDRDRVRGAKLTALADYIALVGLAEIHPHPDMGTAPTILRLFSGSEPDKPTELSAWDAAFLRALYGTDQSLRLQRFEISASMMRAIAH